MKNYLGVIVSEILTELLKAQNKFPEWPDDMIHGAAILSEESGELIRATLQYNYETGLDTTSQNLAAMEMHQEAVQTGAMAVRFILGLINNGIIEVDAPVVDDAALALLGKFQPTTLLEKILISKLVGARKIMSETMLGMKKEGAVFDDFSVWFEQYIAATPIEWDENREVYEKSA